jgi:hypothetical protein
MNRNRSRLAVSLLLVLMAHAAAAWAAEGRAPDAVLDIIEYKAPDGWRTIGAASGPSRTYVAPDSVLLGTFLVVELTPAQQKLDFPATFDRAIKGRLGTFKVSDTTPPTSAKTRQGFDSLSQALVAQDSNGEKLYLWMVAAKVNDRMATFELMAPNKESFDRHVADLDAMLHSVSFKAAPGNAAGAAGGAGAAGATSNVDPRVQQLTDRFAKEADARRKPNTIVGDILTLDGKPLPNVAVYEVYVGGTTIAGERARFNLDVDERGHFEQRLPDGIYKVYATAIVNYAGRRVPVDLVSLDGKPMGTSHDSAKGIVKDFRMAMAGLKPGEDPKSDVGWFGGVVTFRDGSPDMEKNFHVRAPNSKVRVTFTPAGPLVDGSTMQPFTVEVPSYPLSYGSARFQRVPLGVYRITATLVTADGKSHPVAMSRTWGGQYAAAYDLFWESSDGAATTRTEPEVFLRD